MENIVVSSESCTNGKNAFFIKTRSLFTFMQAVHITTTLF